MLMEPILRFRLMKPKVLFALLVMLEMWESQLRSLDMVTPRYFLFHRLKVLAMEVVVALQCIPLSCDVKGLALSWMK